MIFRVQTSLPALPDSIRARRQVIHVPGYTLEEKVRIAEAYLIPKQMAKNGVGTEHMLLPRSTVLRVASSYTREAGVRQLERELAAICRHVALKVRAWHFACVVDNGARRGWRSAVGCGSEGLGLCRGILRLEAFLT